MDNPPVKQLLDWLSTEDSASLILCCPFPDGIKFQPWDGRESCRLDIGFWAFPLTDLVFVDGLGRP